MGTDPRRLSEPNGGLVSSFPDHSACDHIAIRPHRVRGAAWPLHLVRLCQASRLCGQQCRTIDRAARYPHHAARNSGERASSPGPAAVAAGFAVHPARIDAFIRFIEAIRQGRATDGYTQDEKKILNQFPGSFALSFPQHRSARDALRPHAIRLEDALFEKRDLDEVTELLTDDADRALFIALTASRLSPSCLLTLADYLMMRRELIEQHKATEERIDQLLSTYHLGGKDVAKRLLRRHEAQLRRPMRDKGKRSVSEQDVQAVADQQRILSASRTVPLNPEAWMRLSYLTARHALIRQSLPIDASVRASAAAVMKDLTRDIKTFEKRAFRGPRTVST